MDQSKKSEKINPRQGTHFLSALSFYWFLPLLWKGSRKGLNTDDITLCLNKDLSGILGDKLEREWKKLMNTAPSTKKNDTILRKALFNTFFTSVIVDGLLVLIMVMLRLLAIFVLSQLLKQYQYPIINDNQSDLNFTRIINANNISDEQNDRIARSKNYYIGIMENIWHDKFCLSIIIIVTFFLNSTLFHHTDLRQRMVGARMRIACGSLIYRKTLRLSKKSASQSGAGHFINLISNEVGRFDLGFIYVHYIWIIPIQSFVVCYILWQEIGVAAIVGVGILLLQTIPVQSSLSRLLAELRKKISLRSSQRIGIINEIISGIQVIKLYAWEKSFIQIVKKIRQREMKQIHFVSCIRGINLINKLYAGRLALLSVVIAIILHGQQLRPHFIFSIVQYFHFILTIASVFYSLAIAYGAEAIVAITRLQDYLVLEEKHQQLNGYTQIHLNAKEFINLNCIEILNVSANWNNDSNIDQLTLNNIILNVKTGQLCAVIGSVGSGKTSLLHLLMGELPIISGNCLIKGDISYASQEAWLFPGTIRNNILFGADYDEDKYNEIIECCALKTDLKQLQYGDHTFVGESGVTLSGGQRARISLARAIYKSVGIYLLDDPLSAVDVSVGKVLFDKIIGPNGYIANKYESTRILVTHQVHFLKKADIIILIENGRIIERGTYSNLANNNSCFKKLLSNRSQQELIIDENITGKLNEEKDFVNDANIIETSPLISKHSDDTAIYDKLKNNEIVLDDKKETQANGKDAVIVWKKYLQFGGSKFIISLMLAITMLSQIIISGTDYFINYWMKQEFLSRNHASMKFNNYEFLYTYIGLIITLIVICFIKCILFFNISTNTSNNIHNQMIINLLNSPMKFFDVNPKGRILNRFSKDIGVVDELLPRLVFDNIQIILTTIGMLILIIIVNPIMVITLILTLIINALIIKLILKPSQDLKRLEGITKSPVFSHMSTTLKGLSTIRTCGLEEKLISEFDNLQNVHSGVWQLTCTSVTCLGLWLDYTTIGFIACVTFSFLLFKDEAFSGDIGLAISQCLTLVGVFQYSVKLIAESLQQMINTERVLEYTNLDQEKSPNKKPPNNWPENGKIQFNNMSLKYDENNSTVLKNIQLDIQSKWKIGIVGRTGAGKSSLINALFRLLIIEGEILIDDLDTGSISLESLRSKISIIPQDPFLFAATIRYNLDPMGLYDDHQLWNVLENVELKKSVLSLDDMITEGGNNFSVGQRQLLCLARAMLGNNKILVLDEATANVDPQTDEFIQHTIRNKFNNCTIFMIAHRLHTVIDADRIIVMDKGEVKEFDVPYLLLENKKGILWDMINAIGSQESTKLKKIAQEKFEQTYASRVK